MAENDAVVTWQDYYDGAYCYTTGYIDAKPGVDAFTASGYAPRLFAVAWADYRVACVVLGRNSTDIRTALEHWLNGGDINTLERP